MSIFSRYIFRQAASALLIILLSLGGVVWIALALKQLNVVTSQGQSALTFITMTTLALPHLLAVIAPFALLIAVMQTLNRLNSDSETIVMTASGANIWVLAKPLLVLGFLVTMAVGFVNHVAMPWSLQLLKHYIVEVRTDLLTQVIQPGRFSSPEQGLTFHIRDRTFQGELLGLVVDDRRKDGESQAYLSERAQIVKQNGATYVLMRDGHILQSKVGGNGTEIIEFDQYIVDLDQFDKSTPGEVFLKPKERYLGQLLNPDPNDPYFKNRPGKFRSELHERFSNPLYPIAFVLIALAAMGQARSTRQNRMEGIIIGAVAGFGCRLTGLAVNNLVASNEAFVPLMYAIPIGAAVISIVAIWRGARQRGGLTLRDRIAFTVADRWTALRARKTSTPSHEDGGGHRSPVPPPIEGVRT
ncbi:MAG: LPS export ABC transporter permease LptF [Pseudomonadota bacterium]